MEAFPDADILTQDIALSYLQAKRERCEIRVDVAAIRNLARYQIMSGKGAYVFPADYFNYKKRQLPYIMSAQECQRFFHATDRYPHNPICPLLDYTAAVIFRLQYSTGMRPQETRQLRRQDFDFKHDTVYIADSKMHKDRCIAVDHKIMKMCRKYDRIAREMYPGTEIFFPNRNGNRHNSQSISTLFHKCWEMAGNPEVRERYCTPYILRHNFATQTLTRRMEEAGDFEKFLPYLSAYMGHQTFKETCYYLHLLPERLSRMGFMDISDITGGIHEK
jgi:integrase